MAEPGAKREVLLVEDDADIRAMIGQLLELEGYPVFATGNGIEALEHLRAGARPGLILLDLMMPVMNGWQFRAEQSRDPVLAAIPVVVISGDVRASERAGSIRVEGYLKKPLDLTVLLGVVAKYAG